ncbi:MAG: DUF4292 domain-containing protein [Bacteroidetes bacterium QS_9_68_14]|nr:MAG: DUF4292 domain-containing protein [Bacteroidetes bacterium QS_9_68_14]
MRLRPLLRAAALLCGVALLAAGCSGSRVTSAPGEVPPSYPNDSVADIRQAVTQGTDTLRAFRAEARLSVDTPARSGRFSSTIYAKRAPQGDSLLMTLSKMGFEGGRILVTPDSFFVHDAVRGELTYGALAGAGSVLPAPLRSGRAFENLLGLVRPAERWRWQVRPGDATADSSRARYVLTSGSARGRSRTLAVDPARWRALRYTERDSSGTLLEERQFSQFGRFGELFLPRRVELRRPQEESSASVFYRNLALNPSDLPPFALDVPEGTERRQVRAQ